MNVLPISAEELASYCITSFDKLPSIPTDDEYYEDLKEQFLYQSELLKRLKVRLVNLYASVLNEAYGTVSTVLLMEHMLAELENLMGRSHPRSRCPFIDMADALELILVNMSVDSTDIMFTEHPESIIDTLLSGQIGSFLLVRAYRRVGIPLPDRCPVAEHDAFAGGERLAVRWNIVDEYYSIINNARGKN